MAQMLESLLCRQFVFYGINYSHTMKITVLIASQLTGLAKNDFVVNGTFRYPTS